MALGQTPPATAPAAVVARANPRVEVFPFVSVSQPGQADWIGRGIQESLQSEVSRTGATLLIPGKAPAPTDDVIEIARQNKADLAVVGTYQIVGDNVRVTGHVIDAASNATVGGFAATGPQKNLFGIEDALGEQLRRLLPLTAQAQQMAQAQQIPQAQQMGQAAEQPVAPQPQPAPVVVYQEVPQTYSPPPTVNYYYDTVPYTPSYYYPYYGYIDPFPFGFYGGITVFSDGDRFREREEREEHHEFGHRGFEGSEHGFTGRGFTGRTAPFVPAPITRGGGVGSHPSPGFGSHPSPGFGSRGGGGGFGGGHSIGGGGHSMGGGGHSMGGGGHAGGGGGRR
jgi:TolB-like protein